MKPEHQAERAIGNVLSLVLVVTSLVLDWLACGSDTCFCSWPPRQASTTANKTHRTTPTSTTVDILLKGMFIVPTGLDRKF